MPSFAISGPIGSTIKLFAEKLAFKFGGDNILILEASKYLKSDNSLDSEKLLRLIRMSKKDIIVWGHHIFADEALRNEFTHKIFLEADLDTRLANYLSENISNTTLEDILNDYEQNVKPLNYTIIDKYKKFADILIPAESKNSVVFELLANSGSRAISEDLEEKRGDHKKLGFF